MNAVTKLPVVGAPFVFAARAQSAVATRPAARISFGSLLLRRPVDPPSSRPKQQHEPATLRVALPGPARQTVADDDIDPLHRHRAALGAPETCGTPFPSPPASTLASPPVPAAAPAPAAASLEELLPALVRRIAWAGDRRRGSVRLELGAGELAGATLLVHADGGRVQVEMSTPAGVDTAAWRRRITRRLAARGIPTDSVEVT